MNGTSVILWSARLALLLYATATAAHWTGRSRLARVAWICGMLVFVGHVCAAFHLHHHWSHTSAYEETAQRTGEMFGVRSGGGLYANYAFTAAWALDAVWLWLAPASYQRRPRWIGRALHAFMAFLFFNAAVVFVTGWARWAGAALFLTLAVLWLWTRRPATSPGSG